MNNLNTQLINAMAERRTCLPDTPTIRDLYKYSKIRLRKTRARKKFAKNAYRYVPEKVYIEFISKMVVFPIRRALHYSAIGRKLFTVEPLPSPILDTSCYRNSTMCFTK